MKSCFVVTVIALFAIGSLMSTVSARPPHCEGWRNRCATSTPKPTVTPTRTPAPPSLTCKSYGSITSAGTAQYMYLCGQTMMYTTNPRGVTCVFDHSDTTRNYFMCGQYLAWTYK